MKNRNDAGNVHFDESTRELICERKFAFSVQRGVIMNVPLRIPLTILDTLRDEDFDEAVSRAQRRFEEVQIDAVLHGCFDLAEIMTRALPPIVVAMCECLYDRFTIHQANRGNEVWATPGSMQHIGPPPEEDEKYFLN